MATTEEQFQALLSGTEPGSAASLRQQEADEARRQFEQFHGSGVEAALTGGIEAIAPVRSFLPEGERKYRERLEEYNKGAYLGGQLAGFIGGALGGTGIPGLAVGAGRATAARLTPVLGRAVGEKVGSAVGKITAAAVEGAGISLGEATNKAGYDLITGVPGAGAAFFEAAGEGAALGGGIAAVTGPMVRGANWVFGKSFSKRIKAMEKAKAQRLEANEQYHSTVNAIEQFSIGRNPDELRQWREVMAAYGTDPLERLTGTPGAPRDTIRSITMTEGVASSADAPAAILEARRAIARADDKVRRALEGALDDAGTVAERTGKEALADMAALSVGGPTGWAVRRILQPFFGAASRVVYQGAAKTPGIRKVLSASLAEGKLSYKKTKVLRENGVSRYVYDEQKADRFIAGSMEALGYSAKIPAMKYLTEDEFQEIANEIETANIGEFETAIRTGMAAKGVPQEFANPIVAQQQRLNEHLKQVMPQRHPKDWFAGTMDKPVGQRELVKFSRHLRAGHAPTTVLGDFINGQLTKEAAQTWWMTQPLMAGFVADKIMAMVNHAMAHGVTYTEREKRMLGLMVDPSGQSIGRAGNVSLVQKLQMNYASEDESTPPPQVGGPPPKQNIGSLSGLHNNYQDVTQQLTQRATKRA